MLNEYCISVIAVKNAINSPLCSTITHDKIKYKLLISINVAKLTSGTYINRILHFEFNLNSTPILFCIDVRCCPEFRFKPITFHYDERNVYLGLIFQPSLVKKQAQNFRARYRIIERFFNLNLPNSTPIDEPEKLMENDENAEEVVIPKDNAMPSVSELYSMLRDAHKRNEEETVEYTSLPTYFVPDLRSYQSKALSWMLGREKQTKYSVPEFVPIKCHAIPSEDFYFNYRTIELMDYDPGGLKIPTGGILAGKFNF